MNWQLIALGLWFIGWLVSSLVYLRQARQEARTDNRSIEWKTTLPRVILMSFAWPFFVLGWLCFKSRGEI